MARSSSSAQWLRQALEATEGSGWQVPRAVATIEVARLATMIEGTDGAIDVVDAALDELRRAGAIPELADALTIAGRTLMYIGDVERGLACVEEAVELLSAAGDEAALARAWGVQAIGLGRSGRFDQAGEVAERAVETSLALGDEVGAMPAMRAVLTITWRRGDLRVLRARAEQAKVIEERHDLGPVPGARPLLAGRHRRRRRGHDVGAGPGRRGAAPSRVVRGPPGAAGAAQPGAPTHRPRRAGVARAHADRPARHEGARRPERHGGHRARLVRARARPAR